MDHEFCELANDANGMKLKSIRVVVLGIWEEGEAFEAFGLLGFYS